MKSESRIGAIRRASKPLYAWKKWQYAHSDSRTVNDLHVHLCGMRDGLITKMANAHQRGGGVAGWLPLLSQTQAGIEAVESVLKESLTS